jgi:hypothetical protein
VTRLGDLGEKVKVLRELRDSLVSERNRRRSALGDEQWEGLTVISNEIREACEKKDLDGVASSTRRLKNRLRNRSIRKRLERLEAKSPENDDDNRGKSDSSNKKNGDGSKNSSTNNSKYPEGECKCAACKKVIDGSRSPCVSGALCSDCALKKNVMSKKDQEIRKKKKAVPASMAGMMGPTGSSGGPDQEQGGDQGGDGDKQESILRKRAYK